jgi:hypothetical protein
VFAAYSFPASAARSYGTKLEANAAIYYGSAIVFSQYYQSKDHYPKWQLA